MAHCFCIKVTEDITTDGRLIVYGSLPYVSTTGDLIIGDETGQANVAAPLIIAKGKWRACFRIGTDSHDLLFTTIPCADAPPTI